MIIVGIDPGVNGAVTILNTYDFKGVISLPLKDNSLTDIYLYLSEVRGGEVHTRAHKIGGKKIYHPRHIPENTMDNMMEIYLEEPGQIVVNNRISSTDGKKNNTGALLAGMTASRKLGRSVGQWEGIAIALRTNCVLVPPRVWQAKLDCQTRGDKNISKNLATKVFPFLTRDSGKSTITHDVADSLLIALYGYLQYATPEYIPLSVKNNIRIYPRKGNENATRNDSTVTHPRPKRPNGCSGST